jgi:hypothetical protein
MGKLGQDKQSSDTISDNSKIEKKIIKEDYKKVVKEKGYSRSIDTNIPKQKTAGISTLEMKIKVNNKKVFK